VIGTWGLRGTRKHLERSDGRIGAGSAKLYARLATSVNKHYNGALDCSTAMIHYYYENSRKPFT